MEVDRQIVEIEAAVKDNKKSDFSSCNYYSADYSEWLGNCQEDVLANIFRPSAHIGTAEVYKVS